MQQKNENLQLSIVDRDFLIESQNLKLNELREKISAQAVSISELNANVNALEVELDHQNIIAKEKVFFISFFRSFISFLFFSFL